MPRRENWIKAHSEDNNTAALIRSSWAARGVWYALQLHTMDRCDTPGVLTRSRRPVAIADLAGQQLLLPEVVAQRRRALQLHRQPSASVLLGAVELGEWHGC